MGNLPTSKLGHKILAEKCVIKLPVSTLHHHSETPPPTPPIFQRQLSKSERGIPALVLPNQNAKAMPFSFSVVIIICCFFFFLICFNFICTWQNCTMRDLLWEDGGGEFMEDEPRWKLHGWEEEEREERKRNKKTRGFTTTKA